MNNNTISGNLGYRGEDGFSSYDLYVKHGGTLTEEEWLDAYLSADNYYAKSEIDENIYTKTQTDSLLSSKANTSSLSTVATSGSYNDLTNKPDLKLVNKHCITAYVSEATFTSGEQNFLNLKDYATKIGNNRHLTLESNYISTGNPGNPIQGDTLVECVRVSGSLYVTNFSNTDILINATIKKMWTNVETGDPNFEILSKARASIPANGTRTITIPSIIVPIDSPDYGIAIGFWQSGSNIKISGDDASSFITIEAMEYTEVV